MVVKNRVYQRVINEAFAYNKLTSVTDLIFDDNWKEKKYRNIIKSQMFKKNDDWWFRSVRLNQFALNGLTKTRKFFYKIISFFWVEIRYFSFIAIMISHDNFWNYVYLSSTILIKINQVFKFIFT